MRRLIVGLLSLLLSNIAFAGFDGLINDDGLDAAQMLRQNAPNGPQFDEYPIAAKPLKKIHPPILSTWPQLPKDYHHTRNFTMYRTRITEGSAEGPNFAGHLSVVSWGCGTECAEAVIVNLKNGKIYGYLNANYGFAYQKNSRLFVVNAWTNESTQALFPGIWPSYFLWDGEQLKPLKNELHK